MSSPAPPDCRLLLCAGGCERASQALDWAWDDDDTGNTGNTGEAEPQPSSLLDSGLSGACYYACASLVLCYCPALYRVTCSLRGHKAPVRCVRALPAAATDTAATDSGAASGGDSVFSGSLDGTVREWRVRAAAGLYDCLAALPMPATAPSAAQPEPVSALDVCELLHFSQPASPPLRLLAAATDSGVHVWLSSAAGQWRCVQSIALPPPRRAMCVALCVLYVDSGALLHLAVGGVDCRVSLFLCHLDASQLAAASAFASTSPAAAQISGEAATSECCPLQFQHAVQLAGHSDWVRSLSFTVAQEQQSASTAQQQQQTTTAARQDDGALAAADVDFVSGVSVLLASASQDRSIRLWKMQWRACTAYNGSSTTSTVSTTADGSGTATPAQSPRLSASSLGSRGFVLRLLGLRGLLLFDALLSGHDDWVMAAQLTRPQRIHPGSGIHFADRAPTSGLSLCVARQSATAVPSASLALLTCSADNSAIVWAPGSSSSIWHIAARLGELSSGGTHGLYGARWGSQHKAVFAHGSANSTHRTASHSPHTRTQCRRPLRPLTRRCRSCLCARR